MTRPPPQPYRSLTPWLGFTADEHPRGHPLPLCPAAKCRRAKSCISPVKGLYCLRTHLCLVAKSAKSRSKRKPAIPPRKAYRRDELQALGELMSLRLADIEARKAELTRQWKAGDLDHLHGRYDRRGVLKHPPQRRYVEP